MSFIAFDIFKEDSDLNDIVCECCGDHPLMYCILCDSGKHTQDFEGEYINNIIGTMKRLKANGILKYSIIKSALTVINADARLRSRYLELKEK